MILEPPVLAHAIPGHRQHERVPQLDLGVGWRGGSSTGCGTRATLHDGSQPARGQVDGLPRGQLRDTEGDVDPDGVGMGHVETEPVRLGDNDDRGHAVTSFAEQVICQLSVPILAEHGAEVKQTVAAPCVDESSYPLDRAKIIVDQRPKTSVRCA